MSHVLSYRLPSAHLVSPTASESSNTIARSNLPSLSVQPGTDSFASVTVEGHLLPDLRALYDHCLASLRAEANNTRPLTQRAS
jgi:hypothetical protein